MSGEIRDETLVASLPFQLETNDFSKETHLSSIQLPSEVSNVLINSDKSHSEDVQLVHHKNGNESITISYFPKMHQIVLEGRLCRADMIDADGNCTFDRSQIKLGDESNLDDLSEIPSESAVIISEDKYAINDETEKDECPVCRYMKAGPCKSEFIKWDECVTKIDGDEAAKACFPQTVEMMTCFKNFEYYDIMTAGTRPHLYKQSTEVVDN